MLRTVGEPAERFAEDYLRVLRALRFAGHYVLHIAPETWDALVAAVPHTRELSAERVREELLKIVGKTIHASAALRLYADSGVLRELYPELQLLVGLELVADEDADSGDAWLRTLRAVDALAVSRPLLRVTALLHAVGMPLARTKHLSGGWRFTGHEVVGARRAAEVMRRFRFSNAQTERVTELVAKQSYLFPPDAPDAGVRRWLLDVPPSLVRDLFRLRIALWRAHPVARGDRDLVERWRYAHRVLLSHPPLEITDLAIDGGDLRQIGLAPGPRFGEVLRALRERVVNDPSLNHRDTLLQLARDLTREDSA
jgi:tRNA nucleotidyltransferase/poly(A) polymerase